MDDDDLLIRQFDAGLSCAMRPSFHVRFAQEDVGQHVGADLMS